jgi:hypothetical protein
MRYCVNCDLTSIMLMTIPFLVFLPATGTMCGLGSLLEFTRVRFYPPVTPKHVTGYKYSSQASNYLSDAEVPVTSCTVSQRGHADKFHENANSSKNEPNTN